MAVVGAKHLLRVESSNAQVFVPSDVSEVLWLLLHDNYHNHRHMRATFTQEM